MEAIAGFFKDLGLSIIPLFVAMDPVGLLPIILSLTPEMAPAHRRRTIRYAMLTGFVLGMGFIGIGEGVFTALGIRGADFLVAGGLLLLVLSIRHLLSGKLTEVQSPAGEATVGVVPLGTPLLVGPAVLTTLLLLTQQYHLYVVVTSFILNLLLAWLLFAQANWIARLLRRGGLRAVSQIVSLLLAAIAVKMIRQGVLEILA